MKNDLLLLSNSRLYGHGYLEHVWDVLVDFVRGRHTIHFVPYALRDRDGYTNNIQVALQPLGVEVIGLHTARDPRSEVEAAEVLFVGGGNSFRLVKTLQELDLLEPVHRRVRQGDLSYIGSSAGTNMACPTMRTTNDMPIVQPPSFESFGLIPFQINPHYADADPNSTHMGETREDRINEFLEENDVPVLGLREGAWLRRRDDELRLGGSTGAVLFRRPVDPAPYSDGANLSFLLSIQPHFDTPE